MRFFILFFSFIPLLSHAADERPVGKVWIRLDSPTEEWKTRALKGTIQQFLSGFDRISIVNISNSDLNCGDDNQNCILKELSDRQIQIAIFGELDEQDLQLASYETWSRSRIRESSIRLSSQTSLTAFRHRVFTLIQPFVEAGGLIDQRAAHDFSGETDQPSLLDFPTALVHGAIALMLFLFFKIPSLAVKRWTKTRSKFVQRRRHRSLVNSLSVSIAVAWIILSLMGPFLLAFLKTLMPATEYLIGGVAWALVLAVAHKFTLPRVSGMGRSNFVNLVPILKAWAATAVMKIAIFCLATSPFVLIVALIGHYFEWSSASTWMIVAPLSIIVGYFWYLIWAAELTYVLDKILVEGAANPSNAWHQETTRYFRGYLNRGNLAIDEKLFGSILWLPSKIDENFTYGGGLVEPRILTSSWTLPYALGPLADNRQEFDVPFADYLAGTRYPHRRRKRGEFELRRNFFVRWMRKFKRRIRAEAPSYRTYAAKNFNQQNATILGYVIPSDPSVTVPLIANNREDFDAVAELLTEHYADFSSDQDEHELDDTDPTDKDFLFGLLRREFAAVEHQDHLILTFYHSLNLIRSRFPAILKKVFERLKAFYYAQLSKFPLFLSDSACALNYGRNHLIQYLHFAAGRKSHLTARADTGMLYAVSKQILEQTQAAPKSAGDMRANSATIRNRIDWIGHYYFDTSLQTTLRKGLPLARLATLFALVIGLGLWVFESVQFRSVYNERIEKQKEKIKQALERESQDG